jgi:mRNA interferase RelE/StbE
VSEGGRYVVQYDPRAVKELTKLDRQVARRIATAIERLGADPRPLGSRVLAGYHDLWRVRTGDYRVIYAIKDAELIVLALRIAHRSSNYRSF